MRLVACRMGGKREMVVLVNKVTVRSPGVQQKMHRSEMVQLVRLLNMRPTQHGHSQFCHAAL